MFIVLLVKRKMADFLGFKYLTNASSVLTQFSKHLTFQFSCLRQSLQLCVSAALFAFTSLNIYEYRNCLAKLNRRLLQISCAILYGINLRPSNLLIPPRKLLKPFGQQALPLITSHDTNKKFINLLWQPNDFRLASKSTKARN